ncbi:DNA polymerase III subunit gamma and tau, partial [Streptomyces sp. NPDC055663]
PVAPQPPAEAAPAAAGGQRPGAWPTAAAPESGRRPGGWPTASAPGQSPVPQSAPAAAPTQAAPSAPAPGAAEPSPGMTQGAGQVRNMWPDILEAVKNRRRFTWILLSQNAQVTGFDGTTLQIGFLNAGARDNFASSGSEEVLRQALAERFNAQWKIEAVVDPSGGAGAPVQAGGGRPAAPPAQQYQAPAPQQSYEPRPAASPHQQHQPQPGHAQQSGSAPAAEPAPQSYSGPPQQQYSAPEPPRAVAPEDDTPEADDPDLVDSALSGHDLIVRELGATVVEEFTNE